MGPLFTVGCVLLSVVKCFILDGLQSSDTVHIFVSPSGLDTNTGLDSNHPLLTIHKALLDAERHDLQIKDVVIELMSGYHDLQSTLHIMNTHSRRLTIRAYQDQEVHVTGGQRLPSSAFHPVQDQKVLQRLPAASRSKVLQVQLSSVGIKNLGNITEYGFYIKRTAPLEVFENGEPMLFARYPNNGYINVVSFPSSQGTNFTYASDRPKHWHNEKDVWVHGFWQWSWADRAYKVEHIDPQKSSISLSKPVQYGFRIGNYNISNPSGVGFRGQGGYFRFENVLSELDEPGEYYVDRDSGILYLWPRNTTLYSNKDIIYVSIIDNCVELPQHSANVVIEGFTIEACRRFGIQARHVTNFTVSRMRIQNIGSFAVLADGSNIKINLNDIRNTDGGVSVTGGIRTTLTPSGIDVADNIISNFGRVAYVGSDGISCNGVANHIHHNVLWKGSYTGIHWSGNDHIFENNHISNMCQFASDCGGMMTGRDWTWRGNIIRKNHIHDTKRLCPGADVRGIMLDDEYSSVVIENNVFHDNDVHVNIGGGRDNIVRQNIFYNALQYSMQVDARRSHTSYLLSKLKMVPYTNDLWTRKYPKLAAMQNNTHPGDPEGNVIAQNIFYSVRKEHIHGNPHRDDWFQTTNNIYVGEEYYFYAPAYGNFKPVCALKEFVSQTQFPDPILPNEVGPRYKVGPLHIQNDPPTPGYLTGTPSTQSTSCPLKTPAKPPTAPYLPDGSYVNTLYNVSKTGCWFLFDKCPKHPNLQRDHRPSTNPYYRDISAEHTDNSGTDEHLCLNKVTAMIQMCGDGSSFAVIFGPTGAMTLGGDGCYFAQYGCPSHGSHNVGFYRDVYAEQHQNAAHDESSCLSRARAQWRYCGGSSLSPIVSIYKPTGHFRVAGGGCWIRPKKCPANNTLNHMFYDGVGASYFQTDDSSDGCFSRAEYYWRQCGNHTEFPVTAYFRPLAKSFTFPAGTVH